MRQSVAGKVVAAVAICLLTASAAGCSCVPGRRGAYTPVARGDAAPGLSRTVLWFSTSAGAPVPVTRDLPQRRARIWTAIDALCAGPAPGSGLQASLPPGSKLRKAILRPGQEPTSVMVDLDFGELLARPGQPELDAMARTLGQFGDVTSARVLVSGVPVPSDGPMSEPLSLATRGSLSYMRYLPVDDGTRVYLAAQQVVTLTPTSGFDAAAGELLNAGFVKTILPRGARLTWTSSPEANARQVSVTIKLKKTKLSERDLLTLNTAADAIALTLRSVPDVATITVTVDGQEQRFDYIGPIWPNPEASAAPSGK